MKKNGIILLSLIVILKNMYMKNLSELIMTPTEIQKKKFILNVILKIKKVL